MTGAQPARDRGPFADEPRASDPRVRRRETLRIFGKAYSDWFYEMRGVHPRRQREPPPPPPFVDDEDRAQYARWLKRLAQEWQA